MRRGVVAAGVVMLVVGCGNGADKTMRRLGSSKVDSTTQLTSSQGDVRPNDPPERRDSVARQTSELRLRVRDRDALDPGQVRVPRADTVVRDGDADARRGKDLGRKPPKPKKQKHRWFIVR